MKESELYELVNELRRLNDAIEMIFGLPARGAAEPPFVREVQRLIDDDEALSGRGAWAAADNTGQVYVCVRKGFMQPPQCFAVDNLRDAEAYLSGLRRHT
jgi:hypothetical protein